MRAIWLIFAFMAAIAANPALDRWLLPLLASGIEEPFATIATMLTPRIAVHASAGFLLFLLLGLGVSAGFDFTATRRANRALARMIELRRQGGVIDEARFHAAFSSGFGDIAREYAGTLSHFGNSLVAARPASAFFGDDAMVERRLALWLYRALAWLLMGFGSALFFLSLILGIDDAYAAQPPFFLGSSGEFLRALEGGLAALFISAMTAMLAGFVISVIAQLRRGQMLGLCARIDLLFFAQGGSGNDEVVQRLDQVSAGLEKTAIALREVEKAASSTARRSAKLLADALQGPMNKLADAAANLSADQRTAVAETLRQALTDQRDAVEGAQEERLHRLDATLAAALSAAERLAQAAEGAGAADLRQLAGVAANLDASLKTVAARLETMAVTVGEPAAPRPAAIIDPVLARRLSGALQQLKRATDISEKN